MSAVAAVSSLQLDDALEPGGNVLSVSYSSELGLVTFMAPLTSHTPAQIRKLQLWLTSVLESELILNDYYGEQLWDGDQ